MVGNSNTCSLSTTKKHAVFIYIYKKGKKKHKILKKNLCLRHGKQRHFRKPTELEGCNWYAGVYKTQKDYIVRCKRSHLNHFKNHRRGGEGNGNSEAVWRLERVFVYAVWVWLGQRGFAKEVLQRFVLSAL